MSAGKTFNQPILFNVILFHHKESVYFHGANSSLIKPQWKFSAWLILIPVYNLPVVD